MVGRDLTPDDLKRAIIENPVRVGLQPPLEIGFRVIGLERQPFVFREPASCPTLNTLMGWASYRIRFTNGR